MDPFKTAALGIICAITAVTVRTQKPEMAPPITIAAGIIIFFSTADSIGNVISEFNSLLEKCKIAPEYFYTVVKLTAIAYITQFAAEVCRDCRENAIAAKIELAGKIAVLTLTAPIIGSFINLITDALSSF